MPRIDPYQLLKCLSILLSPSGGIRSKDEVNRIASLMTKFSKKLVSKCIYILILKSTDVDLLDMFMSAGGWDLTFNWLSDGIQAKNWPLVVELVELLVVCPVDIERLKGNNCPKLIKLLSKDPTATDNVRELACKVVEQWLAIVKGACEAAVPAPAAEVQAREDEGTEEVNGVEEEAIVEEDDESTAQLPVYKITIRDGKQVLAEVISSDRTTQPRVDSVKQSEDQVVVPVCNLVSEPSTSRKDSRTKLTVPPILDSDSDEEIVKPVQLSKKKMLSRRDAVKKKVVDKKQSPDHDPDYIVKSEKKKSSEPVKPRKHDLKKKEEKVKKDKLKDKKELDEQSERDKATLAKLITPSIGSLGKIPKKAKDDEGSEKKTERKPIEPAKPLPKDPKKYNISVETRKGSQDRPKTVKTYNSKFRSTGLEEAPPPPKSVKKVEKEEEKRPTKRSSPLKDLHPPPEKKPKEEDKKTEKSTPPKSKIMILQESDVFADALTAANPVKDVKKRKRRTSLTDGKKDNSPNGNKPQDSAKPALKFYQDTLMTSEDRLGESSDADSKVKHEKEEPSENLEFAEPSKEDDCPSSPVSKEELEDEVAKGEEAINQVLKLEEKKNVEREKNRLPQGILVYVKKPNASKKSVQWKPERDLETIKYFELDETERVNVTKPFTDMKQMERSNEREHVLLARKMDDLMEEKTVWKTLIPIDIQGELIVAGKKSLEKDIQYARERTTLQAIYFNRRMIPDSPSEPDLEIHAMTEPAMIPLDDQTGNLESVISYKGKPWPESKGYAPGAEVLPPMVVGIESPPPMPSVFPPMGPGFVAPGPAFPPQPHFGPMPAGPMPPAVPPGQPPDWPMGGDGGMMGGGGGEMMMGGGMGLLPPPGDMFGGMGPPPPEFMPPHPPHPPFMGPPHPGMFPHFPPHHPGPPGDMRPPLHRPPWFRQNGGPPNPPGTWRHPVKGSNWSRKTSWNCNNFMKKGYCRVSKCPYKHPTPQGANPR